MVELLKTTRACSATKEAPGSTQKSIVEKKETQKRNKYKKSEDTNRKINEHFMINISSSDSDPEEDDEEKSPKEEYTREDADFVKNLEKEMMEFCADNDTGTKTSPKTEKAMRAINYIQVVQHRCTRISAGTSKEIDRAVDIIMKNIMDLEIKMHAANAKVEVMEQYWRPTGNKDKEETGKAHFR